MEQKQEWQEYNNIHSLAQVSNNNEEISAEMLRVELG